MPTNANFKINASLQADGGFDATTSQVLTLQLEASPGLDIQSVTYSVVSFSKNAPTLTFSNPSPSPPTTAITVTMPGTAGHSWMIRAVINGGVDQNGEVVAEYTRARIVTIRSNGRRKIVPSERTEYDPTFGWTEAFNESMGDILGPTSVADNELARFDGVTGKLLQGSSVTLSDTGQIVGKEALAGLALFIADRTTSGAGAPVTVKGQTATVSGNGGGVLITGGNGVGGANFGGFIDLGPGTGPNKGSVRVIDQGTFATLFAVNPADVEVGVATLKFDFAVASPVLQQETDATNSVTGDTFLIQAQDCSGTTTTGGSLHARPGTGTSTNGSLRLKNASGTDRLVINSTGIGVFNTTPVGQQASGANLTNNVTSGGTDDTVANFTDLTTYANDAATIRNDIYQLARKLKQVNDAMRLYGWLT